MSQSAGSRQAAPPGPEAVIWHDVECGGYELDLPLWRELAADCGGAVLELGAGTGRVTLDLARRGHHLWALDSDPALVRALARRARAIGVRVEARVGDARDFALGRKFALAIAPMQLLQLMGGADGRRAMLAAVRRHLGPGASLAVALADPLEGLPAEEALPPLPDVRELDGWVYSSRPVRVRAQAGAITIERVREAVSPAGELHQSAVATALDEVDQEQVLSEAVAAGFREAARRRVPPTQAYVGSDVVVLEAT